MKMIPLIEPWILPSYAEEVQKQILTGFIGPGSRNQRFADDLASFVGASHCLLTVSGTIALSVAAKSLGLQPGDEILVPAYGVISTINAFASIGLKPRLVDIEVDTGCMSPDRLMEAISEKTKAVCFVNFSGYTGSNLVAIAKICADSGLPLIEDAACALGQNYEGTYAGMFGTVGIYSFSTPKVITTGQGGALVTHNKSLFDRAAAWIDQGDLEWRKTNINRGIGSNLRFTDILAAFGQAQLKDLNLRIERKRTVFQILNQALDGLLFSIPGTGIPLHNIVFTEECERLIDALRARGISAVRQYRTLSTHPAYQELAEMKYPNADFWTRHAVYLPFGMNLGEDEARYIAQALRSVDIKFFNPHLVVL